jgi:hypothetical protein
LRNIEYRILPATVPASLEERGSAVCVSKSLGGVERVWTRSENIIGQERYRENGRKREVIRLNSRKWAGRLVAKMLPGAAH